MSNINIILILLYSYSAKYHTVFLQSALNATAILPIFASYTSALRQNHHLFSGTTHQKITTDHL